jgi:hypothetical protein
MSDTYENDAELAAARADPRYQESQRYRDEVAAKMAASRAAGTVKTEGSYVGHGNGSSFHTMVARQTAPETLYGMGQDMPGADPVWAEAAKVATGYFDGPEAIARAMAAPQYEIDPSYRQAVLEKIGRSQRENWIDANLQALPVAKRFTRP